MRNGRSADLQKPHTGLRTRRRTGNSAARKPITPQQNGRSWFEPTALTAKNQLSTVREPPFKGLTCRLLAGVACKARKTSPLLECYYRPGPSRYRQSTGWNKLLASITVFLGIDF